MPENLTVNIHFQTILSRGKITWIRKFWRPQERYRGEGVSNCSSWKTEKIVLSQGEKQKTADRKKNVFPNYILSPINFFFVSLSFIEILATPSDDLTWPQFFQKIRREYSHTDAINNFLFPIPFHLRNAQRQLTIRIFIDLESVLVNNWR